MTKLDSAGLRGARERGDAKVSSVLSIKSVRPKMEERQMIPNPARNLGDRLLEADGKEPINPSWIEAPAEPAPRPETVEVAPLLAALRKIAELRYAEDADDPFDEALDIADAALRLSARPTTAETGVEAASAALSAAEPAKDGA